MAVRLTDAVNRICERAGWGISPLAVQKLLYLAHMQHLGKTGKPLVSENFEAWDYGPVIPSLYHSLKMFGRSPVKDIFWDSRDIGGTSESEAIDYIVDALKDARPGALVDFTHHPDGAWAKNYTPGVRGSIIPTSDIVDEYKWRPKS